MTVLQWVIGAVVAMVVVAVTALVRLGLWPASLPPIVALGGLGGLLLLLAGWWLWPSASTHDATRAPASRRRADIHALNAAKVPVVEIARRLQMPQDLVRSVLEVRSTRRLGWRG